MPKGSKQQQQQKKSWPKFSARQSDWQKISSARKKTGLTGSNRPRLGLWLLRSAASSVLDTAVQAFCWAPWRPSSWLYVEWQNVLHVYFRYFNNVSNFDALVRRSIDWNSLTIIWSSLKLRILYFKEPIILAENLVLFKMITLSTEHHYIENSFRLNTSLNCLS